MTTPSDDARREVDALRRELAELRTEMAEMRAHLTARRASPTEPTTSRRDLLTKGGLAAAAGIAGAVALPRSAAAAPGDTVVQDGSTTGTGSTTVTSSGPEADALYGRATSTMGAAWGVRGDSHSEQGAGVAGTTSADLGSPTGVYGITDSQNGAGVRGVHNRTIGFGSGVEAISSSPDGTGLVATAPNGVGARLSGGAAALNLGVSSGAAGFAREGNLVYQPDGDLVFYFVRDGRWQSNVLNSGPQPGDGFRPVRPYRAYDSRFGDGPLGFERTLGIRKIPVRRRISPTDGRVEDTDALADDIGAIAFNLTVTNTREFGFMSISDEPGVAASTINWSRTGDTLANSSFTTVAKDGSVVARVGGHHELRADFIIDIVGVYVGDPLLETTVTYI